MYINVKMYTVEARSLQEEKNGIVRYIIQYLCKHEKRVPTIGEGN